MVSKGERMVNNSIEVSVVIPTYNRKALLKDTIDSLLHQTYPKDRYEIIVVDDGSSDGTEELVRAIMDDSPCVLRYYRQENQGQAAARNLGIKHSKGEIIGFTDDDCKASLEWIETAATYFKNYPGVAGLAGRTTPTEEPRTRLFKKAKTTYATRSQGPYPTCNIFYKKQALQKVKGFDPNLRTMYEDYDLTQRIRKEGYTIDFSDDLITSHAVVYTSLISHLKSMKKNEFTALYFKKHPDLKNNLTLGFISNKKHIYPFFTLLVLLSLLTSNYLFAKLSLFAAVFSYSWGQVLTDRKIKKYPMRLLSFPTRIIPDTVRMYYTLRGSIKYRCLIL